jgi:hypothetical protein
MLTDEEKSKIKEEEIFRFEIQKDIESQKRKFSFLSFLNSALGIWILSTIIIGLFTYFFNDYITTRKENKEREDKIRQLDTEIESRISQFWVNIYPLVDIKVTSLPLKKGISFDTVKVCWQAFKNSPSVNKKLTYSIYSEYESRTTVSLMVELKKLLAEKYEIESESAEDIVNRDTAKSIILKPIPKKKIKPYTQIQAIERAILNIGTDGIFEDIDKPTPIKDIWDNFSKYIINDRWNHFFPFTDCLFC